VSKVLTKNYRQKIPRRKLSRKITGKKLPVKIPCQKFLQKITGKKFRIKKIPVKIYR